MRPVDDRHESAAARPTAAPTDVPLITVVVCTRGRRLLLERCIASLRSLDDPNHEILIVENESRPRAADLAGGTVRWVLEPRPGLAFARNTGISNARGDIVAFVDDDCEVDAAWLRELRTGFADPAVSCVTGRVRPAGTTRRSHRWFERLSSFDRGAERTRFSGRRGGAVMPHEAALLGTGCNMAFRRDLFDRVGPFDVALDTPRLIRGGGDLDMFVRILERAEPAEYVPTAVVHHYHRETLYELAKQLFGYGVGIGALSLKYVLERRASLGAVLSFQSLLIRAMARGGRRPGGNKAIGLSLVLVELLGDVLGPIAYVIVRRRNRRALR